MRRSTLLAWIGVAAMACALGGVHAAFAADEVTLESRVSRSKIRIGDTLTYTLVVKGPKGMTFKTPGYGANLGAFEVRDYKVGDIKSSAKGVEQTAEFSMSTFDVGDYTIPPIGIEWTLPNGQKGILYSQTLQITVESLKPGEGSEIKDIKPPIALPLPWKWIAFGVGVLAALIGLGVYLYRRYLRKRAGLPVGPPPPPPRPAHEVALEALEALRVAGHLERGECKVYYVALADTLRAYIEGRFDVLALERTTDECVGDLRRSGTPRELCETLERFLSECDLVKFAKHTPTISEGEYAWGVAVEWVKRTMPQPIAATIEPARLDDALVGGPAR